MNRAIEDELATAMRDRVAGMTPPLGLVARAARQHRRRARIRLGISVTAAAGIAAVVAVGLGVTAAPPRPGSPGSSAVGPGGKPAARTSSGPARPSSAPPGRSHPLPTSPRARLLAAMTSSAQLSYRMHLVNLLVQPGHRVTRTAQPRDLIDWYADYTGVYDPRTGSGSGVSTERYESGGLGNPKNFGKPGIYDQLRFIGNTYYSRYSAKANFQSWGKWTVGHGGFVQALNLNGGQDWAPTSGSSADPAVLLATVRRLGQVRLVGRSGSGAQALDTYRFLYRIKGDDSVQAHLLAGTIVVHHQSNLIARITMQTTVTSQDPQLEAGQDTFKTVLSFSDYGVAVSVHPPAAAGNSAG